MKILFVSAFFPYPPLAGGQSRIWHLIRRLSEQAEVHLLSFFEPSAGLSDVEGARSHCRRVEVVARRHHPYPRRFGRAAPQVVKDFYHPEMSEALRRLMAEEHYDVVQVEYTQMADYLPRFRPGDAPPPAACLTEHDIAFESLYRHARRAPWGKRKASLYWEYLKMLDYETRACRAADCVIAVSERDATQLRSFLPGVWVECVRTGVDTEVMPFHAGPRQPDTVLFLGHMSHMPNLDALGFFYREVFPILRRLRARTRLQILGSRAEHELPRVAPELDAALKADEAVDLVGTVPDTTPYLHQASLMVVPVLVGAGVRVKIFESFAAGLPVVSTTLGAQGIPARDPEHLRLADSPLEMARAIADVLEHADQAAEMAARARRLVEEQFDYRALARRLLGVYRQAVERVRSRT